jgi:hypothetical protein
MDQVLLQEVRSYGSPFPESVPGLYSTAPIQLRVATIAGVFVAGETQMAATAPGGNRWRQIAYLGTLLGVAALVVWYSLGHRTATSADAPAADGSVMPLACLVTSQGKLPTLPEASGLALSRRDPTVLWSLNDSGPPAVVPLSQSGEPLGRVRIAGANVNDWEDVSVGLCGGESCLYIADTGDGGGTQRNDVVVYRVREPLPGDRETAPADVFDAAYPDGEDHESDAVFVLNEQLFLITKGHPAVLFAFPRDMAAGTMQALERMGEIPTAGFPPGTIPRRYRVTDAEASPNGQWVAVRTNDALLVYRSVDLLARRTHTFWRTDLRFLSEPRGEGVAISDTGDVYLASERVSEGAATFTHLKCALEQ